ncbi:MAG TPA: ACT domain-containing protein [Erysipelothrix sp.]|nr:ACT domain-containing protein [Erysipelothrix sp.]
MAKKTRYYLIEEDVMPEAIMKVLEAKMLLEQGKVRFVSEAVEAVGISRSVFYKYHEAVRPFFDSEIHTTITLSMKLSDDPGVLGNVLNALSDYDVNILTINQNIPINHVANVTITFETLDEVFDVNDLIRQLEENINVKTVDILARE